MNYHESRVELSFPSSVSHLSGGSGFTAHNQQPDRECETGAPESKPETTSPRWTGGASIETHLMGMSGDSLAWFLVKE